MSPKPDIAGRILSNEQIVIGKEELNKFAQSP